MKIADVKHYTIKSDDACARDDAMGESQYWDGGWQATTLISNLCPFTLDGRRPGFFGDAKRLLTDDEHLDILLAALKFVSAGNHITMAVDYHQTIGGQQIDVALYQIFGNK
jgi:hypothetical protein